MGGLQPRLRTAVRASGMPGEGSLVLRTYRTLDRPLARFSRRGRLTPGQRSKDLPSPQYHHRDATTRSSHRKLIDLGLMSLQRRGHSTAMCLRHVCPFADTSGNDPGRGGRSPRGLFLAMDLLRPGGYAGAGHGGSSRRPPNGSHASRAHPPALDGCRDVRDDVPFPLTLPSPPMGERDQRKQETGAPGDSGLCPTSGILFMSADSIRDGRGPIGWPAAR
jgi:hypothetical protein